MKEKCKFNIVKATKEEIEDSYKNFRDQFAKENNYEIMTAQDIVDYIEVLNKKTKENDRENKI